MSRKISKKVSATTLFMFMMFFSINGIASNIRYMPYVYHQGAVNKWIRTNQFVICDKCQPVEYDIQKTVSIAHRINEIKALQTPKQNGLNHLAGFIMKNYLAKTTVPLKDSIKRKSNKIRMISEVYFAFDSFNLTKKAKHKLNIMANRYKNQTLLIEGYTDCSGGRNYNTRLAQKRAESVAKYLRKYGVKVRELKSIGKYSTKETDALSRRVEIYVYIYQ